MNWLFVAFIFLSQISCAGSNGDLGMRAVKTLAILHICQGSPGPSLQKSHLPPHIAICIPLMRADKALGLPSVRCNNASNNVLSAL